MRYGHHRRTASGGGESDGAVVCVLVALAPGWVAYSVACGGKIKCWAPIGLLLPQKRQAGCLAEHRRDCYGICYLCVREIHTLAEKSIVAGGGNVARLQESA